MIKKLKSALSRPLRFVKRRPILSASIGIVTIGVVIIAASGGGSSAYDSVVAERGNLIQEVSVTGQVKAVEDIDLAFEQSGTVAKVSAGVGDKVTPGQVLVTLKNNDKAALLSQAEAQLQAEIATLNNVSENTNQDLANSYDDADSAIRNALTKSEDAVRSKTDGIFHGSEIIGYTLTFSACDGALTSAAKDLKLQAEFELDTWNNEVETLTPASSNKELDAQLTLAKQHIQLIEKFVDAVNGVLLTKCALDNSTLNTARTNMATAQTNVLTAADNLNSVTQAISLAKIAAGSANDVAVQEAKVRAAEAQVENYRAQLEKTILRSPINGIVTKQDANLGESVTANAPIVSVISNASFQIETFIPEADISKIKLNDSAKVTLDAYGSDVPFEAKVIAIDIGETVIEGVTTYKTTLEFTAEDDRIKPGMTANIDILTAEKDNVISIPQRAVITKDGEKSVRILDKNGQITEVQVETGLRGSNGDIEIVSGVNEGDKVVTFIKEGN